MDRVFGRGAFSAVELGRGPSRPSLLRVVRVSRTVSRLVAPASRGGGRLAEGVRAQFASARSGRPLPPSLPPSPFRGHTSLFFQRFPSDAPRFSFQGPPSLFRCSFSRAREKRAEAYRMKARPFLSVDAGQNCFLWKNQKPAFDSDACSCRFGISCRFGACRTSSADKHGATGQKSEFGTD